MSAPLTHARRSRAVKRRPRRGRSSGESLLEAMLLSEDMDDDGAATAAAGGKSHALGLEEEGAVILNMLYFLIRNANRVQVA